MYALVGKQTTKLYVSKQLISLFNGTVSQDFLLQFLPWIIFLQAPENNLKVHKIENFFDSDFEICVISLLVMHK